MTYQYGREDGAKGVECTALEVSSATYIKIWGANHFYDYWKCFQAWPRSKTTAGKVHRFFYKEAEKIYEWLLENLEWKEITKINILGFSMGGGIAPILSAMLGRNMCRVVVINSPKIGNKELTEYVYNKNNVYHVYDKGDIVRHFSLFYFKHVHQHKYDNTKPFWKAHNNMPEYWRAFPI